MNYGFFLTIGLIVNTFFVVLFPAQTVGADPFGIDEIRAQKFTQLDSRTQEYYIDSGFFDETGQPTAQFDKIEELQNEGTGQVGSASILQGGLSFFDWVKIGWNTVTSLAMFFLGFLALLMNLQAPLNVLVGVPFSFLYIFSAIKFIMGR
jgi:hypothetical protein